MTATHPPGGQVSVVPWPSVELTRRSLLLGVGAGALVVADRTVRSRWGGAVRPALGIAADPFTLGVASGDPRSDSVVVWTRLAPEPLAPGGGLMARPYDVEWQVAVDPLMSRIVRSGRCTTGAERAHCVHVIVDGLRPAREYWYRFRCGTWLSAVGRTKTAPERGERLARLSLAAASCQAWTDGHYTAHRYLAEEDLDVVMFLGDYVYEAAIAGDTRGVFAAGGLPEEVSAQADTLARYRARYALYKSDGDLQAAHAAAPWIVSWDDHEVEDGYTAHRPAPPSDATTFARRRKAAYQAFWEHQPLRVGRPTGARLRMHRRFTYGSLATIHVLDTRQHRSPTAPGGGWQPDSPARRDASRTMLGPAQERWLDDGIRSSTMMWDVVAQQVITGRLDRDPGATELLNADAWDGCEASQWRLHATLARAKSPIVLTGDVHAAFALANVSGDQTAGVELATTSISSGGDGDDLLRTGQQFLDANPHVRYVNQRRGYLRCTIDEGKLTADFRIVPWVEAPGSPVATDRTFRIPAGHPEL